MALILGFSKLPMKSTRKAAWLGNRQKIAINPGHMATMIARRWFCIIRTILRQGRPCHNQPNVVFQFCRNKEPSRLARHLGHVMAIEPMPSRHFPRQNWLKMESSKSSVVVLPTISPTAATAMRRSAATSSNVKSSRNACAVRSTAARARASAS